MLNYDKRRVVSEKEFEAEYRKYIRRLLLSVILVVASFVLGLKNFTGENNAVWFQRSGSLIVIFSIFTEYRYIRLRRMVTEQLIDYGELGVMTRMRRFKLKDLPLDYSDPTFPILYEPFIVLAGLSGTVIWGYGDLIYRFFTN